MERRSALEDLLGSIPEGEVLDVRVGALWTAVVVAGAAGRRCGLASNLHDRAHHHDKSSLVADAGSLTGRPARDLAALSSSESLIEASIGVATINALLSPGPDGCADVNAEEVIARHGAGRRVAVVGSFPFVPRLRGQVGRLDVLDLHPQGDCLPATAAAEVIPHADVVAITATSLINHTFEGLLALCRPEAVVVLLGPSTPLSRVLFDHGVHLLSGSVVEDVERVLLGVSQGANFRQVRRLGVRLVTMRRDTNDP